MSLILKQEPANTIATPPAGKSTLFVDDNSVMSVKSPDGNVTQFPTVQGSNTQVFFNDEGAINGSANLSFTKTTNTLTVNNGNVVAAGLKTDNLYYANGSPWDLGGNPGGSNTAIQFNNNGEFDGSSNLTFNGTSLNATANLNVTGNAYISGNLTVDGNVVYVNVESLSVEDPLIALGGGPNGNALVSNNGYDRGLILHNYTTQAVDAFMGWDTSNAEFAFASNVSVAGEVVTINTLGNVRANNIAGTLSTQAQPNITSVGLLTGLRVGATAVQADFPNATVIISQDNSGQTHSENIGVVGEAVADSGNTSTWGIGVLGEARANGATKATGVQGGGYVTSSTDTGAAVGVRGYSTQTHSGGYNIGVLGNAVNSGLGSYAFYVQAGDIASIENTTVWDLVDDEAAALAFNSSGKANIFLVDTTDGAEGVSTSGYLDVTGNVSAGGVKTDNLYYANGNPWDLQQPGGSNTQIQFNDADQFGGSAALTFDKSSNAVQIGGTLNVVGNSNVGNLGTSGAIASGTLNVTANANVGNLGTGGLVVATGNVTGGNLTTGGVLSVTGNANVGNLGTAGLVVATGNVTGGNLTTGGVVAATGNVTGGNLTTGGVVAATGNVTGGNLTTGGIVSATGNVVGNNVIANSKVFIGNAASATGYTNPVLLGKLSGAQYIQAGLINANANASSDWVAYSDNGNDEAGWMDMGFTGSAFSDANYTITGNNDGYIFAKSVPGTGLGGNLVIATGSTGENNDIVFATGGFLAADEKMRFVDAQDSFKIKTTTVATSTTTGALVVSGGAGVAGNLYVGGTIYANISGNLVAPGSNTQLLFNDAGTVGADAGLTYNKSTDALTVTGTTTAGNLSTGGTLSVTGNANIGNIGTAGLVIATGNVTGGNLTTGGALSVTGNANIGNIGTTGLVVATGNVTGGNLTTGGVLSVTGNANVGNLGTAGLIVATGNVTGGNLTTGGVLSVTGNANVGNIGAAAGVFTTVTGSLTTAAQPNITSVGTLSSLAVTANVTAGNVYANSGTIGASLLTGTLTTAAQPNVTSVGTLTSLSVTGNITAGNVTGANLVSANYITGILTTAAQPNITSTGTLTSLTVTGTATAGNLSTGGTLSVTGNANVGNLGTAGLVVATGNVTGGNLTTGGALSVTGNANIGNIGTAGLVVATGNVTGGNLTTGGIVSATGNITSSANVIATTNLISDNILGRTGALTITSAGTNTNINLKPNGTGNIDANSTYITNVKDPSSASDAATKQYVDTFASTGIAYHPPVLVATTGTLATATGGTMTYNNGTAGVNANLVTTGTFLLIDGANVQTVGTRILVKDEANAAWNGVYTYANTTTIVRSTDTDEYGPNSAEQLSVNDYFFVTGGLTNEGKSYIVNAPTGTITFGTSNITFALFSSSQVYDAGTGLTLANTTFSISNTAVTAGSYGSGDIVPTFTVNGQGQLTAASNAVITANAANLSGTTLKSTVVTSSLTSVGTLGTLNVFGNANVGNIGGAAGVFTTVTGSLTTAAQPNITSVGTLSSLTVTGNIGAGNVNAPTFGAHNGTIGATTANTGAFTTVSATGQITSTLATGTAPFVVTSTTQVANLSVATAGSATTAGTVTTAAQPNITSVGTLTSLGVSGAVTASTLVSNVATGTAPLTVTSTTVVPNLYVARANVADYSTITTASTGNYYISFASAVSGNVAEAANSVYVANIANGSLAATTFVGALSGAATSATTAGTVTTAAQPNITSVGTLTGLTVGNVTANTIFGNGTITATGNANVGNLTVGAGSGGNITGANLVSANYFTGTLTTAAQPNITSVGTLTSLAVTGNVTAGNANVTGQLISTLATGNAPLIVTSTTQVANLNVATAGVAGTVTTAAQPNITSLGTLSSLTVTGNIGAGNVNAPTFGAHNGTIGATTANTGAFTTISATGAITSTLATGTAPFVVTSTTQVANLSVATAGLATYATTANAVAGANVSGQVANALVAGTVYTAAQPNITSIGTLTGLSLANASTITGNNITFSTGANTNAGTFTGNFSLSAGSKLNATYADLAEKYVADAKYEPGTVLVFGGEHEVTLSTEENSTRVAGVVTTNPAYSMNSACEGEHVAEIALQGRVPVKVFGPVSKGDLLVSGANGYAIANNIARAGTIIGKSLQNFTDASGVIEVAVGRF